MNFEFNEEQAMLRESLAAYLADHYDFEARRKAAAGLTGWRPEIWAGFADRLGLLGATLPLACGGFGGGAVENMIVMEELGKALSLEPWLETIVLARPLLEDGGSIAERLLAEIAAGGAIAVPVLPGRPGTGRSDLQITGPGGNETLSGSARTVRQAAIASHYIVAASDDDGDPVLLAFPVGTVGIERHDYRAVDGSWLSDLLFDRVALPAGARVGGQVAASARIDAALDAGLAALCAESLGIQRRLLEQTVAYAKERKQFGRPIGEFQALQHRMADMFMRVEESVSMTYMAALRMTDTPRARAAAVAMAKVAVDEAARFVGQSAIQIHGGMGMTRELPVADGFARLTVIALQLGTTTEQLRRYDAHRLAA
jgi:alkylation response protein AidB-like acyl-CoA dehydrogenase